jgi:uncharacterized cupin superfamily protein
VSGIAHWDEVEGVHAAAGHLDAVWHDLGTAAGTRTVGLQRIRIAPGKWSTPAHIEHAEEEIFWVLSGSGLAWQDEGGGPATYAIGPGDCLVHLARGEAHTLQAGPDGLDVLVFGQRVRGGGAYLPRAGLSWHGPSWVRSGGEPPPWQAEARAGAPEVPVPSPRPSRIVHLDAVPGKRRDGATVCRERRNLGRAAGSVATGLQHVVADPDKLATPPHCHSAEEEIFVVLAGDGALVLGDDEEHPVRSGTIVSREAGTGTAHVLRGGPGGLTFLAYGTREPNDICYYPRSGKVLLGGVGVMGRIEQLDYWDGED